MRKQTYIIIALILILASFALFFLWREATEEIDLSGMVDAELSTIYYIDGESVIEVAIRNQHSSKTVYVGDTLESRQYADDQAKKSRQDNQQTIPMIGLSVYLENETTPIAHSDDIIQYQISPHKEALLYARAKGDLTEAPITRITYTFTYAGIDSKQDIKHIHTINVRIPEQEIAE